MTTGSKERCTMGEIVVHEVYMKNNRETWGQIPPQRHRTYRLTDSDIYSVSSSYIAMLGILINQGR